MPIPLAAVAAGSFLINKLFNKRPEYQLPPDLQFFGPGFENARAAAEQFTRAKYGGGVNDLRDILANQGLLGNQGALTDATTKMSIAQGQDIAGVNSALTGQEYGAQQDFNLKKYGASIEKNKIGYDAATAARANELASVNAIGAALGQKAATPNSTGAVPVVPNPTIGAPGITPGRGAYSPTDPMYGTGLGLEAAPHTDYIHHVLKTLFGFGPNPIPAR